jgi:hypothetical protein
VINNYKLIAEPKMVDPIDEIALQARQGSVAAIIQVLNQKLAELGVRTRAVFTDGVLQLLCEAAKVNQLEESILVDRIRQILEEISPRYIRRVNINSRMFREQQLLWLEAISYDPENQLLWSKQIILARPNFLKRFVQDLRDFPTQGLKPSFSKTDSSSLILEQKEFQWGMIGGLGLSLCLIMMGLALYFWLNSQSSEIVQVKPESIPYSIPPSPSPSSPTPTATSTAITTSQQKFAEAVRLAQQASDSGKVAQTREEWLAIATKWQEASALMTGVTPDYPRYDTAVNRAELYRQYGEEAQQEAEKY